MFTNDPDRITPLDLVHHMLTAGTTGEWIAFTGLLLVVALWAVLIGRELFDAGRDLVRMVKARKAPVASAGCDCRRCNPVSATSDIYNARAAYQGCCAACAVGNACTVETLDSIPAITA